MSQTDEPYKYAGDDPVNESDPSGMSDPEAAVEAGAGLALCTFISLTEGDEGGSNLDRAGCAASLVELGFSAGTANAITEGISWTGALIGDATCFGGEGTGIGDLSCIAGLFATVYDLEGVVQGTGSVGWGFIMQNEDYYSGPRFSDSETALQWMSSNPVLTQPLHAAIDGLPVSGFDVI